MIAFDVSQKSSGSGSSLTFAHTCSSGANRLLVVGVYSQGGDLVTGVTYAGVSMTQASKKTANNGIVGYIYYLLAPTSGANNVVISTSVSTGIIGISSSYTGVSQVAPEATTNGIGVAGVQSLSYNITTIANNAWVVNVWAAGMGGADLTSITPGGSQVKRNDVLNAAIGTLEVDDLGPVSPAGLTGVSVSYAGANTDGSNLVGTTASFAPVATPTANPRQIRGAGITR